ncbi:50S ribosomal protein L1 [Candidatus Daviesbacteria bacterium]|nr:50S ribosomal protein L1 [Candidatus Daviesbacteria bacterium]
MGKTKTKIMDDSVVEEKKSSSKKAGARGEAAKPESIEANSAVERTSEVNEPSIEQGAKQTSSESTGETSDASRPDERATQKKSIKPGKAKPRSKKYQEVVADLDRTKTYPLAEAVDMVKKLSYAKFNATIEAHINTNAQGIRGLVSLPYASGKKLTILAFGKDADKCGADIVGSDEVIEQINTGKVNFDLVVATPSWMPKLAKVARILGPRGLMPNPKNGTITDDLKKTVEGFQAGKTEYKTESKAPVIHLALGKLDQTTEELSANIKTLLQTLGKTRIKKVSLSPTMGPSIKVDLASI